MSKMTARPWTWTWAPRSSVGATCGTCGHIHCGTDSLAVGRFNPTGPVGYRAGFDGAPIRSTRAAAVADMCERRAAR